MRVKIGNTWYNSDDQYVAVQFTEEELKMIKENLTIESAPNLKFGAGVDDGTDLKAWIRDEVKAC